MTPWLSVVMPVHRPDGWLDAALASIAAAGEVPGAIEEPPHRPAVELARAADAIGLRQPGQQDRLGR